MSPKIAKRRINKFGKKWGHFFKGLKNRRGFSKNRPCDQVTFWRRSWDLEDSLFCKELEICRGVRENIIKTVKKRAEADVDCLLSSCTKLRFFSDEVQLKCNSGCSLNDIFCREMFFKGLVRIESSVKNLRSNTSSITLKVLIPTFLMWMPMWCWPLKSGNYAVISKRSSESSSENPHFQNMSSQTGWRVFSLSGNHFWSDALEESRWIEDEEL